MRARFAMVAVGLLFLGLGGLVYVYRPDLALHVATGAISQTLCDEVFVSGLEPERVYREEIEPDPGLHLVLRRLRYSVDRAQHRVTATWAGHFASTASYSPRYGCTLGEPQVARVDQPAATSEGPIVEPANPRLKAAIDRAFAEPDHAPYRRVRAIVIMKSGNIIAERYAVGIGPDTPLLAYSVSKSLINALIGILVHDGKLSLYARAPVSTWKSESDPRHHYARSPAAHDERAETRRARYGI